MRISLSRRRSRFAHWINSVGPDRIAHTLQQAGHPVTLSAVRKWRSGTAIPRTTNAALILQMAGGKLDLRDIVPPARGGS